MVEKYLKLAISDIESLIEITILDIKNIRNANHNDVVKHKQLKDKLLSSFSNKKMLLDTELKKVIGANKEVSEEGHELIETLKHKLSELKDLNTRYGKIVLGVNEFYNSLVERVMPTEMNGYNKVVASSNSYFQAKV